MIQTERNLFLYRYISLLAFTCVLFAHVSRLFHHVLILVFLALGFIYHSRYIFRRFPVSGFWGTRALFIVWAILSITWTEYFNQELNARFAVYIYQLLVSFTLFISIEKVRDIEVFENALALGGVLLSFYILYYSGHHVLLLERFENEAMSINTAATKFAYIAFTQVVLFFRYKKAKNFLFGGYFFIITLFTGSKTAFLMMLTAGVIFGAWWYFRGKRGITKINGIIMIFCLVFLIWFVFRYFPPLYQIIGRRILQLVDIVFGAVSMKSSYSTYVRYDLVQTAWQGFVEKPVTGWGELSFIDYNKYKLHAHSSLMEILFDLGFIGFITYFYQYFIVFKLWFVKKQKSLFSIVGICIAIASFIEVSTSISHNDLLNWLMMVIAYKYIILDRSEGKYVRT